LLDEEATRDCDNGGGRCTYYTVTEEDGEKGEIYFACSTPKNTWDHCKDGQKVKVIVTDDKPPSECFEFSMDLSCDWYAEDSSRCDLVPYAAQNCPAQCLTEFQLQCSWFEEDPESRCAMVENSSILCRKQCNDDCPNSS